MYLDTFRNTFLHTPININNRRSVVYIYRSTTDQCTSDCDVVEYWVVYVQEATTRATRDKIVACRTHARVKIWGVHTGSVRACV